MQRPIQALFSPNYHCIVLSCALHTVFTWLQVVTDGYDVSHVGQWAVWGRLGRASHCDVSDRI